jgi:DNA mismatch repair protein MutL
MKLMVPIDADNGTYRLHGFIGQPGVSRANRQEELFFVNRRAVDNRTLHYGLMEGYHNALMKGRSPVCCLFLEMDPAGVDVNIHPAKREVRFHDDFALRHFVVKSVQEALLSFQASPLSVSIPSSSSESVPSDAPWTAPAAEAPRAGEQSLTAYRAPVVASTPELLSIAPVYAPKQEAAAPGANRLSFRLVGCVANLYLVAESSEGLVLIDQHAAHERVLFEQMLDRVAREEVKSQRLLFPVQLELPPREADFLRAQLETLQRIGLGVHEFGPTAFLIDALPPLVKTKNVEEFVRTLVVELQEAGGETRRSRRLGEEVVTKTVCRHAVKANDRLKPEEWEKLVEDLLNCRLPYTCPHGRPTMIQFSTNELEKKFGRAGAF